MQVLNSRCGLSIPVAVTWRWWCRSWQRQLDLKKMIGALIVGLIYCIWRARNMCRLECSLVRPKYLVDTLIAEYKMRFCTSMQVSVRDNVRDWLRGL
ncbi:hypothetical protein RND81_14G226600 [Saponaria officinalis]